MNGLRFSYYYAVLNIHALALLYYINIFIANKIKIGYYVLETFLNVARILCYSAFGPR